MIFHGFQKMTLLDFPGKVACTLFTAGCNFRCPFCHNSTLVLTPGEAEKYPEDEILSYLKKRKGLLEGVAVTGGEPTLDPGLPDFLRRVKDLGFPVKLDTNGTAPALLASLVSEGLVDYVAMDIKNCKEKYAATAGVPSLDMAPILESVSFLLSGAVDYEFRTTLVRKFHTVSDIASAAEWISGARRYFLQNFVDSGLLIDPSMTGVPKSETLLMLDAARPFVQSVSVRGL